MSVNVGNHSGIAWLQLEWETLMKAQVRLHLYRLHSAIAVILLSLVAIPASLEAGVLRNWDNGGGDNNWFNATNWDPNGGPDSDDLLLISFGSPTTASTVSITNNGSIVLRGWKKITCSF